MTMSYCVQIGEPTSDNIQEIIDTTFAHIDATYNTWNPNSEVSKLNNTPAKTPIRLSRELATFLHTLDQLVRLTDGRFDPTIAPAKKALLAGKQTPKTEAIGWHNLHFSGNHVWKDYGATTLDLGGAAKGHGVDLLFTALKETGYQNIYVEWGGEIRTSGKPTKTRPWTIAIRGGETLTLKDKAIATSGNYMQQWQINNRLVTHIIDPKTQKPLELGSITSTSVLAPSCVEADAIATALMLFPSPQEAQVYAQKHNIHAWINGAR